MGSCCSCLLGAFLSCWGRVIVVVSSGRPRVGKIGRAVRKQLRELEPGGMKAVSAALAEATADLADSAWRDGKSREFSTLLKDLERLLREVQRDDPGPDDAGEAGRVEPESVQPRGLAAVLGARAAVGDSKVS